MTDKTSGPEECHPAQQPPALLTLRGRLNRRRSSRQGQPALAEELASALALAALTTDLEPGLRNTLIKRAARRFQTVVAGPPAEDQA